MIKGSARQSGDLDSLILVYVTRRYLSFRHNKAVLQELEKYQKQCCEVSVIAVNSDKKQDWEIVQCI